MKRYTHGHDVGEVAEAEAVEQELEVVELRHAAGERDFRHTL